MSVILASTSPRRRELLALLGITFEIIPPAAEEIPSPGLSPLEQAKQFALDKALSIARRHPDDLVLGSDTVIEIDGTLVGKPQDLDDAGTMLRQLRGRSHHVHTAIALIHEAAYVTVVHVETASGPDDPVHGPRTRALSGDRGKFREGRSLLHSRRSSTVY